MVPHPAPYRPVDCQGIAKRTDESRPTGLASLPTPCRRSPVRSEFEAVHEEKLTSLRASLYEDGGAADDILASWVDALTAGASDLVDQDTVTEEAEAIERLFTTE